MTGFGVEIGHRYEFTLLDSQGQPTEETLFGVALGWGGELPRQSTDACLRIEEWVDGRPWRGSGARCAINMRFYRAAEIPQ